MTSILLSGKKIVLEGIIKTEVKKNTSYLCSCLNTYSLIVTYSGDHTVVLIYTDRIESSMDLNTLRKAISPPIIAHTLIKWPESHGNGSET